MIIYLYGPDTPRRGEETRRLLNRYRARNPHADLLTADFGEEPERVVAVLDFLNQPALFTAKKAAFIREGASLSSREKSGKRWIQALKSFADSVDVFVILSDEKKPSAGYAFLLEPPVKHAHFAELEGAELRVFVEQTARRLAVSFGPEALGLFLRYLSANGERTLRATKELEKLSLLTGTVTSAHLAETIVSREEPEFYRAVQEFLYEKMPGRRIALLEELFLRREDAAYVFNMLAAQAKGKDAAFLAACDVSKKSGGLEDEEALTLFALR